MPYVRRLVTILPLLLSYHVHFRPAGTNWIPLESLPLTGFRYEDVAFPSVSDGWVVGSRNVFRTLDAGQTWHEVTDQFPGMLFRSVNFMNSRVGWIGSLDPTHPLYETRDGGNTWRSVGARIVGPLPHGICGIWSVGDHAYAVGKFSGPAHFLLSDDRGQSWVSQDLTSIANGLVDVYFHDEEVGIIVGVSPRNRAVVLGTTDGGRTWHSQYEGGREGEIAWKVSFATRLVGYIAIEHPSEGRVLKTGDGGHTWSELPVPGTARLQAVGFVSPDRGWVGSWTDAALTVDGGLTWSLQDEPKNMNRIRSGKLGDFYGIGERLFVLQP